MAEQRPRAEYKPYPRKRYDLPAGGKVTGTYVLVYRGDGSLFATTDGAHVNDHNPAIDYRGESWLVSVDFTRASDGSVTLTEWADDDGRTWNRVHMTRRQNWGDVPPSYRAKILEVLAAHVATVWDEDLDRAGLEADVAQEVCTLEREESRLAGELRAVRKSLRHQRKRLG